MRGGVATIAPMAKPPELPPIALSEGGHPNSTWELVKWIWRKVPAGPVLIVLGHALLVMLMVALFFPQTGGQDLWWYLSSGKLIIEHGGPVSVDPYSWTALSTPWINHEWLWCRTVYVLYQSGGLGALVVLKYLLVFAWGAAFLWMGVRLARDWYLGLLTALLTIPLLGGYCDLRPQLVTYILVTLLFAAWYRAPKRPLLALGIWVLLLILWSNVHAAVVFGVALLCLFLLIHAFQRSIPVPLAIGGVAVTLLAPLANPYGPAIYHYALGWVQNPELKFAIEEWHPITAFGFITPASVCWLLWPVATFVLIGMSGFFGRLRWEPQGILMWLVYLMPLLAIRHLPLAHIALIPWWFQEVARVLPWLDVQMIEEKFEGAGRLKLSAGSKPPTIAVVHPGIRLGVELTTALIPMLAMPASWVTEPLRHVPHEMEAHLLDRHAFPSGAWAFLHDNFLQGRLFNYYDMGGYLTWRIAEEGLDKTSTRVFIDGRLDTVYPAEVIHAFGNITSVQPAPLAERSGWKEYADKIDIAILPPSLLGEEPDVLRQWKALPDWAVVYRDLTATVLIRKATVSLHFLDQAEGLYLPVPEDANAHLSRGLQVEAAGDSKGAKEEFEAAIKLDPTWGLPHRHLALLLMAIEENSVAANQEFRLADEYGD